MSEEKGFSKKLNKFFDGKGFYIVLSLCVALIGVSAYYLLTGSGEDVGSSTLSENTAVTAGSVTPEEETTPEDSDAVDTDSGETPVWNEQEAADAANAAMVWPLDGKVDTPYSMTSLIYNKKMGDWRTNSTVELAAAYGTQVMACGSGVVEKVYTDDLGGTTVVIEHAGGLKSVYANLEPVPTVVQGDSVMTGEVIGAVGTTAVGETKDDPHLSFAMTLDGQSVDPGDYLPDRTNG